MGLFLSTRRRPPSLWSDLPPELGGVILRRLLSHADRLSFRAVCRQWRLNAQQESPSSLPPALPWIRLEDLTFRSLPGGELRRYKAPAVATTGRAICLRSCSDGWLTYSDPRTGTCLLANPFTRATIPVPPDRSALKTVVCSPDLVAAILECRSAVAFYRPGAPSWSVSPPAPPDSRPCKIRSYYDIAFHRGKLYSVTETDDLFSYELVGGDGGGAAVEHVIKEQPCPSWNPRYLVASRGKLFMLKWIWSWIGKRRVRLKVFEADLEMGRWLELEPKDGHAVFVSPNSSKAIPLSSSSSSDHKFQQDHVYFVGIGLWGVESIADLICPMI